MSGILVASVTGFSYATFDPANKGAGITLSNGNLTAAVAGGTASVISTVSKSSGKWYWEITYTSKSVAGQFVGIALATITLTNFPGHDANGWGYEDTQFKWNNNSATAYGAALVATNIIGVKLDMDGGSIEMLVNNSSQGVMYNSGITGAMFAAFGSAGGTGSMTANFGATAFTYAVPSGYNPGLFK